MYPTFDICGMRIPFPEIRNYQVVKRDFIFRPAYIERPLLSIGRLVAPNPYKFEKMVPYAQLISESEYNSINGSSNNTPNIGQTLAANIPSGIIGLLSHASIVSDLASGVASGVVDSVANRVSSAKNKNILYCMSMSGRVFTTKLKDVPALLTYANGSTSDIYKRDSVYFQLGKNVKASIVTVDALLITTTDSSYLFYGNGIQLDDIRPAYTFLCRNVPIQPQNGYNFTPYPSFNNNQR